MPAILLRPQVIGPTTALLLSIAMPGCGDAEPPPAAEKPEAAQITEAVEASPALLEPGAAVPLIAPDRSTIPEGPVGESILRGEHLVTHTRDALPENVGNGLNCTSCHLQGGTVAKAGPWVGIAAVFPEYRSRNAKMNALQDRVNDCFERSLNGRALDPAGPEMTDIITYMTWLSSDVPMGHPVEGRGFPRLQDPPEPDPARGEALYAQRCASCHGPDGQGITGPEGQYVFPALWGDRSFNIGAGMARLDTAAAFVRWNMPLGQGGTLTDQEAYDIAAFFTQKPRPDLPGKERDWPKGGKPRDARY